MRINGPPTAGSASLTDPVVSQTILIGGSQDSKYQLPTTNHQPDNGQPVRIRPVSRPLLLAGMALTFLAAAAFRWLTLSEFLNDHFDHVALAQQLRLGALPLRDFVDEGMPLMYLVSAAAWSLIKTPFLAEAVIVALAFAITAALSFRSAALVSQSILAAAIASVAQVAVYPRTYSYPKLLVQAIAIAVAWWAVKHLTVRRIAGLSAATAVGYYFRHDHALYLGVATVTLLAVAQWRSGLPTVARSIALYAGFAAVFVLPHLVYVQWAVGVPTYLAIVRQYVSSESTSAPYQLPVPYVDVNAGLVLQRDVPIVNVRWTPAVDDRSRAALEQRYHLDPVEHEGTTWRYRIRDTSATNVNALRADVAVEDTHNFDQLERVRGWRHALASLQLGPGWRARENSLAILFWLSWLLPIAAAAMAIARGHEIPAPEMAAIAMLVALALCTDIVFLRSPLDVRLPDLAVSHTVLAAWIGATVWRLPVQRPGRFLCRAFVAVATATAIIAIALFAQAGQKLTAMGLKDGPSGVMRRWHDVATLMRDDKPGPVPSNPSAVLLPFIEYVRACTSPQDRLLYTWYSPEFYVVADRGFAGDHRRIYRRLTGWEQARTLARLQQERVPFVIIPIPRRQWLQQNTPDIWRYIQSHYVPMAMIPPDDAEGFQILRESAWAWTSVYPQTDWPCLR